ncbi:SSI family serine proteinase inhibitor [Streptomyces sp. NPDC058459]|uniref:SSI family serine proteinase inhibitor n=1 Tax=Streptomyces sp. NPDC058459 TaxID=3346508 RepID=UPI00366153A2
MSAPPRRGPASLAVLAVSLLGGLTTAPVHAAPAGAPAYGTPTTPAALAVPAAHAAPARGTSAAAVTHAAPATAPVRPNPAATPAHTDPASAPDHASRAAPPTDGTHTAAPDRATPALPPPPLPDDRGGDRLTLVVRGAGPGRDGVRQLFCHPAAGDHPDPDAACRVLDENTRWGQDTFAPVRPDSLCTMIDGGPATAHVTGYWAGRPVKADFSRRNGCEIARWDRLVPFLPGVGA